MTNYSVMQNNKAEDRNISFDDKKSLLAHDNRSLFYQFLKYLYNNHRDSDSSDYFSVTVNTVRYEFPSPVMDRDRDHADSPLYETMNNGAKYEKLRYDLNAVIREIARGNINEQELSDTAQQMESFEKLDGVRRENRRNRQDNHKSRKANFNKAVISPDIPDKPTRMRLLLLAYALKMSREETTALMKSAGTNPSINIWNGYEVIVFYAIARKQKDITLTDLDALGKIMSEYTVDEAKSSLNEREEDTDAVFDSFDSLIDMDREASIRKMKELLLIIKAADKNYSEKRRDVLNSMFKDVMMESGRIFKDDYREKCYPGEDTGEETFRKCRNAITDQFFPYYENQIQYRYDIKTVINLGSVEYLPAKNHLNAIDRGTQPVTMADLEFVFFLKYALDHPLNEYGEQNKTGIKDLIAQRFGDYIIEVNEFMDDYHFSKVSAMDAFDYMLMICMQTEYPIRKLHELLGEYFSFYYKNVEFYDI